MPDKSWAAEAGQRELDDLRSSGPPDTDIVEVLESHAKIALDIRLELICEIGSHDGEWAHKVLRKRVRDYVRVFKLALKQAKKVSSHPDMLWFAVLNEVAEKCGHVTEIKYQVGKD